MKRYKSDEIADVLRFEIEGGRYRVGASLPSVDELRSRFGVGEFAVRAALHKLRDDGLVVVTKHVGVTVAQKAAHVWKGCIVFVHCSRIGSYYSHKLAMQLAFRFEEAGWLMHSVFLESNADGSINTEMLMRHVSGGVAFAVVLSEFRQIAESLDRASVPYIVVDGYEREFPNARAEVYEIVFVLLCKMWYIFRQVIKLHWGQTMEVTWKGSGGTAAWSDGSNWEGEW